MLVATLLAGACGPFARGDESPVDDARAAAAADDPCALITRQEASDYTNADMGPGHLNTSFIPPFAYPGQRICTFEGLQREASRLAGRPTELHIALTPAGMTGEYAREVLGDVSERVEAAGSSGEVELVDELPLDGEEVVRVSEVAAEAKRGPSATVVLVDERILAVLARVASSSEADDYQGGERAARLAALILNRELEPVGLAKRDDEAPPDGDEPTPPDDEPPPPEESGTAPGDTPQ